MSSALLAPVVYTTSALAKPVSAAMAARRFAIPAVEAKGSLMLEDVGVPLSALADLVAGIEKMEDMFFSTMGKAVQGVTGPMKGLYIVKVQDTERQWLQVSKLVAVSDIGLIVKQGQADAVITELFPTLVEDDAMLLLLI